MLITFGFGFLAIALAFYRTSQRQSTGRRARGPSATTLLATFLDEFLLSVARKEFELLSRHIR